VTVAVWCTVVEVRKPQNYRQNFSDTTGSINRVTYLTKKARKERVKVSAPEKSCLEGDQETTKWWRLCRKAKKKELVISRKNVFWGKKKRKKEKRSESDSRPMRSGTQKRPKSR